MNIAIIPARGGSKRIKNKNIKLFHGKPIIYFSITAAIKSKLFDRIVVSTDSYKIKKIAEKYGAEVPFIRPKFLSDDFTNTQDVIKHAVKKLVLDKKIFNVCCIYPTAPLISNEDLINSYKKFQRNWSGFLFAATKYSFPIQRSFYLNKKKKIKMYDKKNFHKRSQDLKDTYHDAGQFYWATNKTWLDSKQIVYDINSSIFLLPRLKVQDIDNLEDWKVAEKLYKLNNEKK